MDERSQSVLTQVEQRLLVETADHSFVKTKRMIHEVKTELHEAFAKIKRNK